MNDEQHTTNITKVLVIGFGPIIGPPLCHSEPFGSAQGKLREESEASRPGFLIPISSGFGMTTQEDSE